MTRQTLRAIVFPSDDTVLSHDVAAVIERLPDGLSNEAARTAAEDKLRPWYRSISIRDRDAFGGYPDDPATVWYVYRDGRVRRPNDALDRLYDALGAARTTYGGSERALARAHDTARSAGYHDGNDVGRSPRDDRAKV